MPKHFVRKTLDRWLARSAGRFHHPPRVMVSRRDFFVLQFTGVIPAIQWVIRTKGTVGVYQNRAFVAFVNLNAENSYRVAITAAKRK